MRTDYLTLPVAEKHYRLPRGFITGASLFGQGPKLYQVTGETVVLRPELEAWLITIKFLDRAGCSECQ